jgi:hypothetical protein
MDIYCDVSENNELKVDWYPGGVARILDGNIYCREGSWISIEIQIREIAGNSQIEINSKEGEGTEWIGYDDEQTVYLPMEESEDGFIWLGNSFTGIINFIEIIASNGDPYSRANGMT